jgi:D-3-phosphoglycerate dehydrogenase
MGDPDAIISFVHGAEMLVTHLAPLSAGMMAQLPLRFVAVVARPDLSTST